MLSNKVYLFSLLISCLVVGTYADFKIRQVLSLEQLKCDKLDMCQDVVSEWNTPLERVRLDCAVCCHENKAQYFGLDYGDCACFKPKPNAKNLEHEWFHVSDYEILAEHGRRVNAQRIPGRSVPGESSMA